MPNAQRLTRRQLEVARLLAEGLTNREIAERLFIDERTVEGHVRDVLGRLELRRSQVGAWLAESGDTGAIPRPPGNLSVESSSFVGRERELEGLVELAGRTRLLTVTGAGGVGKTRIALRLASRLQSQFRGGAWLVDLSEVSDAAGVEAAIAATAPSAPAARTLVILDCCEHVVVAAAAAARRLLEASDHFMLVTTSRQSLGVAGEAVWPLAPLSEADALRLLEERAGTAAPQVDLAAAQPHLRAICARLGGVPLAIELVAPRLRAMSAADLAAALSLELGSVLASSGKESGRHRSVEATIAWSYDSLAEPEQRLFRHLGVAAGPVTFEDVVALAGPEWTPAEVLSTLLGLVEKSLVHVDAEGQATRYRLLDLVRDFARRRLTEAGELEAAERNRVRHFTALARRAAEELPARRKRTRGAIRAARRHPVWVAAIAAVLVTVIAGGYVLAQPPAAATITTVATNSGENPVYTMAFGPDGSLYYPDGASIRRLAPGGHRDTLPAPADPLAKPSAVQVAADGSVYVADRANQLVREYRGGQWQTLCGGHNALVEQRLLYYDDARKAFCEAVALALAPDGRLFIMVDYSGELPGSPRRQSILELSPTGGLRLYAGQHTGFSGDGGAAFDAAFDGAAAIARDGAGNIYVADRQNHRVRRIDPVGVITTIAGTGTRGRAGDGGPATAAQLDGPSGVAVDAKGNLYISSVGDDTIRRVDPHGIITTVAGSGRPGFGGDGGSASTALLAAPEAIAVDRDGNLYVDDVLNKRIRKITFRT